jgi:hypothetical protein
MAHVCYQGKFVETSCPCAEIGKDGTKNHNELCGSIFKQGNRQWIVTPCKNHRNNYVTAFPGFKRLR